MNFRATFSSDDEMSASFSGCNDYFASFGEYARIPENNYNNLTNKPSINYIELIGNRLSNDLGLQDHMEEITNTELQNILR